jgi:two-component system, OmpR family, phosphate regulon response regulator PhoB
MSVQKPKVLVVEDEADIRNLIAINLRTRGYDVITAENGSIGLELVRKHKPLVMTLDLMMPGMNGLDVCQALRSDPEISSTYVLMVTAMGETEDRLAGFEAGADDYVPKPFSVDELVLRVQAAFRRLGQQAVAQSAMGEFTLGILKIDDSKHRIWISGEEIAMTITEYRLLFHLASKAGNLCSRGELLQEVWELPPNLNTRTVDTHIKRLRQKLGAAADYIETVRGAGYRFSENV